jgi:hypothetical protein
MREPTPNVLIEPSFAAAIKAIETAEDLPLDKRRHWSCSLRVIAKMLGRSPELVPARWTAVRGPISRLHHVQRGMERKTLINHKGNGRGARLVRQDRRCSPARCAPSPRLGAAVGRYRVLQDEKSALLGDAFLVRTRHPAWGR